MTPELAAEILADATKGVPVVELAHSRGVSTDAVRRLLRVHGVKAATAPRFVLAAQRRERAREMYQAGYPVEEIVRELGVSGRAFVYGCVRDLPKRKPEHGRRTPAELAEEIVFAASTGAPLTEIAAAAGVAVNTVRRQLVRRGVPVHEPPTPPVPS